MLIYVVWIVLAARLAGERRDAVGGESDQWRRRVGRDRADDDRDRDRLLGLEPRQPGGRSCPRRSRPRPGSGCSGSGVVATFIAIQAFYAGAQRIGAAQASIISTVEPIWTIVARLPAVRLRPDAGPARRWRADHRGRAARPDRAGSRPGAGSRDAHRGRIGTAGGRDSRFSRRGRPRPSRGPRRTRTRGPSRGR